MTLASILKKALMAVTGLAWVLLSGHSHLLGKLFLWAGPEKYNHYAEALVSNPLLIPAEILLVVFLLIHVGNAWRVTNENSAARPKVCLEAANVRQ